LTNLNTLILKNNKISDIISSPIAPDL